MSKTGLISHNHILRLLQKSGINSNMFFHDDLHFVNIFQNTVIDIFIERIVDTPKYLTNLSDNHFSYATQSSRNIILNPREPSGHRWICTGR